MMLKLHLVAAITAILCMVTFFVSTIWVELFGGADAIALVKQLIVTPGLYILIPAIAVTGGSGFVLARGRSGRLAAVKQKRMPFIAANGVLLLLPAAILLAHWATQGMYDGRFYLVQGIELFAGAINITLMALNIRDGLTLAGKLHPAKGVNTAG